MIQMTREDRDEWVAALRSGKYKQGRKRLMQTGTGEACCLGVLCDLYTAKGLLGKEAVGNQVRFFDPKNPTDGSAVGLPMLLMKRFKTTSFVLLPKVDKYSQLSRINDRGIPFSVIANVIEKYVEIIPSYST